MKIEDSDEFLTVCKVCEDSEQDDVEWGMCANCRSNHIFCEICQEEWNISYGDECRHVFFSERAGDWIGPGMYGNDGESTCKESLGIVLNHIGVEAAQQVLTTIQSGKMQMSFSSGFLRGTGRIFLSVYSLEGEWLDSIGEKFTNDLTNELQEDMTPGMNWLDSLELEVTKRANALTVEWITQWLAVRSKKRQRKT